MASVDIELALVGAVAMLEPATLLSSTFVLVLGTRPLRTGSLFYIGGLGVTLAVGVLAALVLGNAAAATPTPSSSPKTWVSIFKVIAGAGILAYVAWAFRRPVDPEKRAANIARLGQLDKAGAFTIVGAGAVLANAGVFMVIALITISQLDPTALQYFLDWTLFALVSMLPLGIALVLLRLAPSWTAPKLDICRRWVERHARAIALIVMTVLALSLLRDGISALIG